MITKKEGLHIMVVLIARNNPERNKIMLVALGLGSASTIKDFTRKIPHYSTDTFL